MAHATLPTGVGLEYETFGDSADPAIVLVAGFGAQMISWDAEFCNGLANRGRYVVRFDNRDCGASTSFEEHRVDLQEVIASAMVGDIEAVRSLASYRLADLADDTAALVEELGLGKVHVVGASMGGMVAQLVAIRHPNVVCTLTSMMSSTGTADAGQSTPEAFAALTRPVATDREGYIADFVARNRVWSSRRYFDEGAAAELAAASFDRGINPAGTARQLAALLATGSLESELEQLSVPTLVIHGADDTLITPSGGRRTAAVIANARLLMLDDMGHDRPKPLWPSLLDAIVGHTAG